MDGQKYSRLSYKEIEMITRMECPKCQYSLEAMLDYYGSQEKDYVKVRLSCYNGHKFSARVTGEHLIEETE